MVHIPEYSLAIPPSPVYEFQSTDSAAPPLSEDTARAARRALRSEWLGKQVPATRFKAYMNRCSGVANELRETLLRPGRRQDLIEAMIYCLDVTDVSRNALAMPHVDTTSET